ncbi:nuclease PIN, partial [Escherichia coli]|nr:nuclease PIN [Escherichia coli]
MNRTITGLYLCTLLVSYGASSVLQADELVTRDNFFVAGEDYHQSITETGKRTGRLIIKGTLVSSPCILETSEIKLPLPRDKREYVLRVKVSQCGNGVTETTDQVPTNSVAIVLDQRECTQEESTSPKKLVYISEEHTIRALKHGDNQLKFYISKEKYIEITNNTNSMSEYKEHNNKNIILPLNI